MIFDKWNPEKILRQQLIDLPTWTVSCSHCTLGNPKSHFFQNELYKNKKVAFFATQCRMSVWHVISHGKQGTERRATVSN